MKKVLVSLALLAAAPCVANAEPLSIAVQVPADLESAEASGAYTDALMSAVVKVCRDASDIGGIAERWTYSACVQQTRVAVAKEDPTGLLADRLGLSEPLKLAATP